MQKQTRIAFNAYLGQQAKINDVGSATETFTVAPTPAQKLESAIQQSTGFLKKINIFQVDEAEGDAILLGITGPTARRTKTSTGARRKTRDVSTLNKDTYACKKTNFDTVLKELRHSYTDQASAMKAARSERSRLQRIPPRSPTPSPEAVRT